MQDFQYYEDGKDHGINVREKAKQLEALLKDDERLKNERIKALKARERFAQQTTGFGTGSDMNVSMFRVSATVTVDRSPSKCKVCCCQTGAGVALESHSLDLGCKSVSVFDVTKACHT